MERCSMQKGEKFHYWCQCSGKGALWGIITYFLGDIDVLVVAIVPVVCTGYESRIVHVADSIWCL